VKHHTVTAENLAELSALKARRPHYHNGLYLVPTSGHYRPLRHRDSVAVRLAQVMGAIEPADVPTEAEDSYYGSGAEACAAGLAGIESPDLAAVNKINGLIRRGVGRFNYEDDEEE